MRTWARWTAKAAMLTAGFVTAGVGTAGLASAGVHITGGNNSIGGGNQVNAPISIPVNVCGNAAALPGTALVGCKGGASVSRGDGDGSSAWLTSGNNSIGGGNQVNAPVKIPVNICGNAVAVLGTAIAHCKGGAWTAGESATSSGTASLLAHRSYMSGMLPRLSQLPVLGSLPIQAAQLGGLTGSAAGPPQASLLSA